MIDVEPDLARYLAAVQRGERREAIDITLALLQRGVSAERVITDLLARAQTEIGLGWQQGRWGVAMEHRASDIADSALRAVVQRALSAPGAVRQGSRGRVVVACSEGEWHVLPALMAAGVLRLRGADVSFIGSSASADDLAGLLGHTPPSAVAVTCAMPMSLVGAWRSISALRAVGMTIVCGGAGFGTGGRWALALGADRSAPDFEAGADLLLSAADRAAPAPRDPVGAPERIAEALRLAREHETLVGQATPDALRIWSQVSTGEAIAQATHEDLTATLLVIGAATLVDDLSLVTDYVTWFSARLTARGLPQTLASSAFEVFLGVIPATLTHARVAAVCGMTTARSAQG